MEGDPEIDLENTGRFLRDTSRVYVDEKLQIVHKVDFWEIVRNPDGSERRPPSAEQWRIQISLARYRCVGRAFSSTRTEACRKFVFSGKVQLHHINGLTYDFLYGMAKELEEKNSLMLIGAGPKSNQPLILRAARLLIAVSWKVGQTGKSIASSCIFPTWN